MNSINRNQTEQNHQDLSGQEAVQKIRELVKKGQSCFFCTAVGSHGSSAARPMNVRQVEEGNLWFLSASDSHQNKELALDPSLRLYFQGSDHSDFLQLNGNATISRDRGRIEELWEFVIKTWFTEGVDDPRITVIKVVPSEGYYWDNRHGNAVAGVKMLIGACDLHGSMMEMNAGSTRREPYVECDGFPNCGRRVQMRRSYLVAQTMKTKRFARLMKVRKSFQRSYELRKVARGHH